MPPRPLEGFRPLLAAAAADLSALPFPLVASPKLDGVRALVLNGQLLSRSLKPLPNRHLQRLVAGWPELEGLDGELVVGDPRASDCFRRTSSAVMSIEGTPLFTFYAFDWVPLTPADRLMGYTDRASVAALRVRAWKKKYGQVAAKHQSVALLISEHIELPREIEMLEESWLADGYEGVMLRRPDGPYKHGRSTLKEATLLKVKRFADAEAAVVRAIERVSNRNDAVVNALGLKERSSKKELLVPAGTLGALQVCDLATGRLFEIGTGFTQAERDALWRRRGDLAGLIVRYKHQEAGAKDLPRFPVFTGFRDPIDL